jgi:hypothetical protein
LCIILDLILFIGVDGDRLQKTSGSRYEWFAVGYLLSRREINNVTCPKCHHNEKVKNFHVYKREKCKEFIQFYLQNFLVGVWLSAREHNVEALVGYMFKEARKQLAFVWSQIDCIDTGIKHHSREPKQACFLERAVKVVGEYRRTAPLG